MNYQNCSNHWEFSYWDRQEEGTDAVTGVSLSLNGVFTVSRSAMTQFYLMSGLGIFRGSFLNVSSFFQISGGPGSNSGEPRLSDIRQPGRGIPSFALQVWQSQACGLFEASGRLQIQPQMKPWPGGSGSPATMAFPQFAWMVKTGMVMPIDPLAPRLRFHSQPVPRLTLTPSLVCP